MHLHETVVAKLCWIVVVGLLFLAAWCSRGCVYVAGDQVALKVGNFEGPANRPTTQPSSQPSPGPSIADLLKGILP